MTQSTEQYWNQRYKDEKTGWDVGFAAPAIIKYCLSSTKYSDQILIPGCGSGYEGLELYDLGFENIHLLDISEIVIDNIKMIKPEFPTNQLLIADFFKHKGKYDQILEHVFFCALPPEMRDQYAKKAAELLKSGGQLTGLLFNQTFDNNPPYGGDEATYRSIFEKYFNIIKMEPCRDSIPQRKGSELFFIAEKK